MCIIQVFTSPVNTWSRGVRTCDHRGDGVGDVALLIFKHFQTDKIRSETIAAVTLRNERFSMGIYSQQKKI